MSKCEELFCVKSGETKTLTPDWYILNDAAAGTVPRLLRGRAVRFPERVKVFIDHDTPCGSVEAAALQKELIACAENIGCELMNGAGISYQIMLDRFVAEGQVVASCSPHAPIFGAANALGLCLSPEQMADALVSGETEFIAPEAVSVEITALPQFPLGAKDLALMLVDKAGTSLKDKAVEFCGAGAAKMPRHDRITLCQMVKDTGATAAFFDVERASADFRLETAALVPLVAGPDTVSRVRPLAHADQVAVNEVFIGGCSGGRIEDLRAAAEVLRGRQVPLHVRLMVAPATSEAFLQAAEEGLIDVFFDAGAIMMGQGCSVCWGRHQGFIGENEVLVSSGSRCSRGVAGPQSSKVYVCSPVTAARCALAGKIYEEREVRP